MGLQHISMRNTAFLLLLFLCSCANSGSDSDPALPARFELLTAEATGVDFTNRVENSEAFNIFSYRKFYNGGRCFRNDARFASPHSRSGPKPARLRPTHVVA